MNPGAGVNSFDALHDWYAALAGFRTEAQTALTELALALQRAPDWLAEQQQFWQRQIRIREDAVTQARAELTTRRYADTSGHIPDCTVQEKNLRRAQAHLEAAQDRVAAVRRWTLRLPREINATYEGPINQLAAFLDRDVPAGLAHLARQLTALEQYADLRPNKEQA